MRAYLGHVNARAPCNEVLPRTGAVGALFLGGAQASSRENLEVCSIAAMVQTAKGLESFYPLLGKRLAGFEAEGALEVLRTEWDDVGSQVLSGLGDAVRFVHRHRAKGSNVLVSCAQGKSRSTSLVVAYLLATSQSASVQEALQHTQSKRAIAEPNPGFMAQLHTFHKSEELKELKEELK